MDVQHALQLSPLHESHNADGTKDTEKREIERVALHPRVDDRADDDNKVERVPVVVKVPDDGRMS